MVLILTLRLQSPKPLLQTIFHSSYPWRCIQKKGEKEENQNFDLILVDAFSSDAIPTHLLTTEAIELYLRHLNEDGVIAINISNKHLDILPVVQTLAEHHNLGIQYVMDLPKEDLLFDSEQVLLSRNKEFLKQEVFSSKASPLRDIKNKERYLWTDNYSSLFWVLR